MSAAYLDIYSGNKQEHSCQIQHYTHTSTLLKKHASIFDLPSAPELLTPEQQEILIDLNKGSGDGNQGLLFQPPQPLLAGRITFVLDSSTPKAKHNFMALCSGEKGSVKSAPNKKLHYLDCPIHRVVKGFVAQGGDVTRGDGSGGESIYGPKFPSEKQGLQVSPRRGSIAMANSGGKNPNNTSQFFIVLSDDEKVIEKLKGKYVVFGRVKADDSESERVLQRLDEVGAEPGSKDEKPVVPVWVGGCGVV
ncbi:hypothetical protein E1B28_002720 [Marasmius oreades]|uniref:Peptidyl-prolyl cis-trans isomerase n=1 Tax=Marasmius oreades TaxID=181124 RepID=A0A9P7UL43_9AGAR|nr:uncharacterized protein E1B28_002720 [Marasmius oreades]KAG7086792.1 hypothetical protein E1B28_002720 [Marasmius oreades]